MANATRFYSSLVQQAQKLVALRSAELDYAVTYLDKPARFRAALRLDDAKSKLDAAMDAAALDVRVAS